MAKDKELEAGDRVAWDTSQGPTTGEVKRRLTKPTKIKGHEVKASNDNPEYLVETERTHKEAAHRPEELRKLPKKKAK